MKIANTVISGILAVAVVVLFVLHFSGGESKEHHKGETIVSGTVADVNIAYFNMDSVFSNWGIYNEYQQELAQRQTEKEAEFAGKTETFYQSVQDAEYKIQRGLVTRAEAEQLQQNLAAEQQNLQVLQNQYMVELQEEGMVKNRQLLDMVERYVAEMAAEKGYSYVYSYTFGGNLIYGASPFNITDEVVTGLNEKFQQGTELE